VTTVEDYKKGACLCRSCKNVFQNNEIEHKYIERNGQLVYEAICPCCGSTYFGLIDYPVSEEELIYKNNKFYGLSHKREEYIEKYKNDEYLREVIDQLYV